LITIKLTNELIKAPFYSIEQISTFRSFYLEMQPART